MAQLIVPALDPTRAALVDRLDALAAALADGAISVARVANLDNLDATVGSRLAAVKSIQRGTITIPALSSSATATIASVDTAKAMLHYLGSQNDGNGNQHDAARLTFTNATTITATRDGTLGDVVVAFEVVEFT